MSALETEEAVVARGQHRVAHLRRSIPVVLALLDGVLVIASFALAYWVRYSLKIGPQIQDQIAFGRYEPLALLLLAIIIVVLALKGAYSPRLGREMVDEVVTLASAATISIAAVVVITSMLHEYSYSRGLILYLWLLLILVLAIGRALFRVTQAACYRRGWGSRRLLVVGASNAAKMVMQSVMNRPDLGYQLAGFVESRASPLGRDFGRFRALGTVFDIPTLLDAGQVDDIIVALPASEHEEISPIVGLCERHGVGLKLIPDLFEMSLGRVQMDDIAGIPLLDVRDKPGRRVERLLKRVIDVAVSSLVLIVASPLFALIAILIRLESGPPVLFAQQRLGIGGRPFSCWKFRTMRRDAHSVRTLLDEHNEMDGPHFKMRNDPRCTPLGRRLRRWSLDEMPQLWNVLKGDMSLVGPRPPLPHEARQYDVQQSRRLEAKPGMTGMWQVHGRSDLGFDEMVMMDLYYIDNWSLALDARILLRTVAAVLRRHGAY